MSPDHDHENPQKQLPSEEEVDEEEQFPCPTNLQLILDFGKDGELCPETFRLSEVSPALQCGRDSDEVSCYEDAASIGSTFSSFSSFDPCDLAALLDGSDVEPPPFDLPPQPPLATATLMAADELGCSFSSNQNEAINSIDITDNMSNGSYAMSCQQPDHLALPQFSIGKSDQFSRHQIPPPVMFQNDGTMPMPPYMDSTNLKWRMGASFPFLDPISANMGLDFQPSMEMPISTLGGFPSITPREEPFLPTAITSQCPRPTFPSKMVSSDGSGACGGCPNGGLLPYEVASSNTSSFKVGKLSTEEREEKLRRYRRKRNQRNFGKKIKYACRKTLADSRPRVRGRFAKNDDPREVGMPHKNNHDHEDGTDMLIEDVDFLDSADIFADLDSMKCNYILDSFM